MVVPFLILVEEFLLNFHTDIYIVTCMFLNKMNLTLLHRYLFVCVFVMYNVHSGVTNK
jgi:hypothetical protein